MRHPTEEKNELMGKKIPSTATTHNIVHTFWRELMERVNCNCKNKIRQMLSVKKEGDRGMVPPGAEGESPGGLGGGL